MRNIILYACLALAFIACRHSAPTHRTAVVSESSVPVLAPARESEPSSLILGVAASQKSVCGRWRVDISDDAALHVSRLSKSGKTTISPGDWRAGEGAFVFIENDERVWAYDGQHNLFLLTSTGNTLV